MNDWIVPQWQAPRNVRSLITTRCGGVSLGAYASMNLATHVGDDPDSVADNRRWLQQYLPSEPVWLQQVHGTAVARADEAGAGAVADGACTRRPGVVCAVLTADCLPVLLCSEAGTAVGIAHAGWRGLAAGIVEATVEAMQEAPGRLMAYLGPGIGPAAFEVGDEVHRAFCEASPAAAAAFVRNGEGKWLADLYSLARQRLAACGVASISGGGWCTHGESERFYSFRREGNTGRMASLIWIES
jgi:hypothetical protein